MKWSISISVVIPTYNIADLLKDAIECVLQQTYQPSEIIVVDDGSSDNTREVVLKYPKVTYLYQENSGAASARNRGVASAKSEWISFLDSDDLWSSDHLERLVTIVNEKRVDWACSGVRVEACDAAHKFEIDQSFKDLLKDGCVLEDALKGWALGVPFQTPGMLIKRDLLFKAGCFNTELAMAEDLNLWFSLGKISPRMGFSPVETVTYRRRAGSLTMTTHDDSKFIIKLLTINLDKFGAEGEGGLDRFSPVAKKLSSWILHCGITYANVDSLKQLLQIAKNYLPKKDRIIIKIVTAFPFILSIRFRAVKLGVLVKRLLRKTMGRMIQSLG